MIRTHVAANPEPFEVHPTEQTGRPDHKPRGFWWEVDGDWRRWCADENYGRDKGHLFEVDLGRSRILRITTVTQLDAFHVKWSQNLVHGHLHHLDFIRWDWVAEEWDGIEIAPYLWERRLHGPAHSWYYGFDCASGCVWNPVGVRVKYLDSYTLVARDWAEA